MTETVQMRGYVKADAEVKPGEMVFDWGLMTGALACFKYFCLPPCSARCLTTFKNMKKIRPHVEVVVSDARKKEAEEGLSKRQFFEKYGFVLMKHQTKMTNEDWLANTSRPGTDNMLLKEAQEAPSAVRDTYAPEIEPLTPGCFKGLKESLKDPGGHLFTVNQNPIFLANPQMSRHHHQAEWGTTNDGLLIPCSTPSMCVRLFIYLSIYLSIH